MSAREYTTAEAVAMALQHIRICAPDRTVEAALEAIDVSPAPVFDMEAAVDWQLRVQFGPHGKDAGKWSKWQACSKEHFEAVRRGEGYFEYRIAESRALFPSPPDMEALRRELEATRACAYKYLGWHGVTDPVRELAKDIRNPEMAEVSLAAQAGKQGGGK